MKLRDWPIVRKLGFLLAINTAIAVFTIALVFSIGTSITRYNDTRQQLLAMAEVVGENSRAALAFNDPDNARSMLRALRGKLEITRATLVEPSGRAFALVDFGNQRSQVNPALASLIQLLFPTSLSVSYLIADGSNPVGRLELQAFQFQIWSDLLQSLALMGVIALGLSTLAVYFGLRLRRIVTDPLLGLARLSHRVSSEQDYSLRATALVAGTILVFAVALPIVPLARATTLVAVATFVLVNLSLIVLRLRDHAQIGEGVADFGALIEARAADDAIGKT